MTLYFALFLLASLFSISLQDGSKKEGDVCLTTRHEEGICRNLYNCPEILQIVQYEAISSQFREYLIESACDKDEDQHTIILCCPKELKTFQTTTRSLIGNLSEHPNIHLLPLETCGERLYTVRLNPDPRKNVIYYEYPWTARIARLQRSISFCGGVLINKNYVLTYPLCTSGTHIFRLHVVLGEYVLERGVPKKCTEDVNGEMICIPEWKIFPIVNVIENKDLQLVLLRLERPAYEVTPVCLPVTSELLAKDYTGATFLATGWRRIAKKTYFSNILYKEDKLFCNKNELCAGNVDPISDLSYNAAFLSSELFNGKWRYFILALPPQNSNRREWLPYFIRIGRYRRIKWILDKIKK